MRIRILFVRVLFLRLRLVVTSSTGTDSDNQGRSSTLSVCIEGKALHKAEVNARAEASVASKSSVSRGLTMPVVSFFGISRDDITRVKKFFDF